MASNYERLFLLEKNQFLKDCPVLLCAGAILKHTSNGNLVGQLKFKNISDKVITALGVQLSFYNPAKEFVYKDKFSYLDLNIKRDIDFGSKVPIQIKDKTVRSFDVVVSQVVFSDGSVWNNEEPFSNKFGTAQLLSTISDKDAFLKKVREKFGAEANELPEDYKVLWKCTCGSINSESENKCHHCGAEYSELLNFDFREFSVISEKDDIYRNALNTELKAKTESEYLLAIEKYKEVIDWKDSQERIQSCLNEIEEIKEKQLIAEEAKKKIAMEASAKKKRILKIVIPAVIVIIALVCSIPLINTIRQKNAERTAMQLLIDAKVGDVIKFGHYEQDNNTENGEELIEWLVLDVENDKVLLISKNALDCIPFNIDAHERGWEKSFLRKWLNNDFYDSTLSESQKNIILSTTATTGVNAKYNIKGDEEIEDNIFVLSINEAEMYFGSSDERKCSITEYARAKGSGAAREYGLWWLRTQGMHPETSAVVFANGDINYEGYSIRKDKVYVRPAMWVSIGNE